MAKVPGMTLAQYLQVRHHRRSWRRIGQLNRQYKPKKRKRRHA